MKALYQKLSILVAIILTSGCGATFKLKDAIEQSKSVREEFVVQEQTFELYPARCVDESNSICSKYMVYGALHGNHSILIAANRQGAAVAEGGKKSSPYNVSSQDLESGSENWLKSSLERRVRTEGAIKTPYNMATGGPLPPNKSAFKFPDMKLNEREALVIIANGYVDTDEFAKLSLKEEQKGRPLFLFELNEFRNNYIHIVGGTELKKSKYNSTYLIDSYPIGKDFAMVKRSRVITALMGLGYLFSVPFDIVTFPFQLGKICITCR